MPAASPNLIESKSFKLYLNSFNQTRCDSLEAVQALLVQDLSACAGAPVSVTLFTLDQAPHQMPSCPVNASTSWISRWTATSLTRPCCKGPPAPDRGGDPAQPPAQVQLPGHQPAGLGIRGDPYRGPRLDRERLLRYLISFRQHNEFHEQCIERIFTDLKHFCAPEQLTVHARYTRRGGLDINPSAATGSRFRRICASSASNHRRRHPSAAAHRITSVNSGRAGWAWITCLHLRAVLNPMNQLFFWQ